jgi:hypothetical protein
MEGKERSAREAYGELCERVTTEVNTWRKTVQERNSDIYKLQAEIKDQNELKSQIAGMLHLLSCSIEIDISSLLSRCIWLVLTEERSRIERSVNDQRTNLQSQHAAEQRSWASERAVALERARVLQSRVDEADRQKESIKIHLEDERRRCDTLQKQIKEDKTRLTAEVDSRENMLRAAADRESEPLNPSPYYSFQCVHIILCVVS